jgi:predicted PhzF superfamily epimerase YddE/YHI9
MEEMTREGLPVRLLPSGSGAGLPSQGRWVGRGGRVAVEFDHDTIWLGGHAVTCIEGSLTI